MLLPEAWDKN